ncbi:ferrous iron transport protein A [Alkanindiges sp. WGS2144]|uniref:FeoA family protein n=1 Tax=Alkanindiges sp. WGS2144 TaxID=3366808 RepID=UPI0037539321
MQLSKLKRDQLAVITAVMSAAPVQSMAAAPVDAIGKRLTTLGFVPGEQVKVLAMGLFGRDPILVQIGFTRFALRRAEAERIEVEAIDP